MALRTDGHAGGSDRSRILEADDVVGRSATPCRSHKNGFQPHSGSIDDCRQEKHQPLSQRLAGKTKSCYFVFLTQFVFTCGGRDIGNFTTTDGMVNIKQKT